MFKVFENRHTDICAKAIYNKGGNLNFNSSAVKTYRLNDYKFVIFMVSQDTQELGFLFTNDKTKKGLRKFTRTNGCCHLTARPFFRHCGFKIDERREFNLYQNDLYENDVMLKCKFYNVKEA